MGNEKHMQSHLASVLCLAAGISFCALPSFAQNRDDRFVNDIDAKQRQACTPDVQRLCNDYVPDVPQIVACLKRERANLSPACGEVFAVPEQCKVDIQTQCKDYLVVIPSVVACLKRELDQSNLSAECTQAFAALQQPTAPKKPTKASTAKNKKK